jgi:surface protein
MGTILMKTINTYINEKLRLTNKRTYSCQPKGKQELWQIIIKRIKNEGPTCDLNDIDVSKITNMSQVFDASINSIFKDFNGDISLWDVSNVKDMDGMFWRCERFNCDLSMWDVSNVVKMPNMFWRCKNFNRDISMWDVSNVEIMNGMFYDCEKFNQDLNSWDVSNVKYMTYAFYNCPTLPDWYDGKKYDK